MSSDGEDIAGERCLSARIVEMNHRTIVLEEIDFLNSGNGIDRQLLQSRPKNIFTKLLKF